MSIMLSFPSPVPKYSLPSVAILEAAMNRMFCIKKGGLKII
jgi:hypothetical protein